MPSIEAIEREIRRRRGVMAAAFPRQREAIEHAARRKALLLPRRSGKTFTCMLDAFADQRDHPGALYGYIALTRPSAETIAWPICRQLNRDYDLGCHFQESKLSVTFANDAQLRLFGADQKEWTERLRGVKWRRLYVDEAAFYRVDLQKMISEILEPGLMDSDGSLYLISTPGDICAGYFYDVTKGEVPGWELFRWTPLDNPHVAVQYQRAIDEKRSLNPDIDKSPGFRREYLGEWTEDDKNLVYTLGILIDEHQQDPESESYVLAVDFGYKEDATSFTLCAYSSKSPDLYILESWKQYKMLIPDVADEIRAYQEQYPGVYVCGDPASGQLLDELRSRFEVQIYDAEKTDKPNWIRLYNSDAAVGRIKIVRSSCEELIKEQKKLTKLIKFGGQWKEHPGSPNDCCDSSLYAYRRSFHFRYAPEIAEPLPGSAEALQKELDAYWETESERFEEDHR